MERTQNIPVDHSVPATVGDLREWHFVEVTCPRCYRRGRLYRDRLRQAAADDARLIDLEKRFACTGCGNREANEWRVFQIGRSA